MEITDASKTEVAKPMINQIYSILFSVRWNLLQRNWLTNTKTLSFFNLTDCLIFDCSKNTQILLSWSLVTETVHAMCVCILWVHRGTMTLSWWLSVFPLHLPTFLQRQTPASLKQWNSQRAFEWSYVVHIKNRCHAEVRGVPACTSTSNVTKDAKNKHIRRNLF